ncbi:serine palmitoyltransferase 2 [Cantharellus anzutake]|uniref:serine palmitoyltransferase 2 n=1 Tax=Cantharellus anzutake TaxID=1750568 RepID=UPI001903A63C|nr:serine palmitoyltransferase 2 [Cantharellus anzutake]KAF8333126.1 serine palmitoyltransferase 2 [Cantharellus anzutake]
MPSPMQSPVSHNKKSSISSLKGKTAAAYLSALAEADAKSRARLQQQQQNAQLPTPTPTPAMSLSFLSASSDKSSASTRSSQYDTSTNQTSLIDEDELINDKSGLIMPIEPPTSAQVFKTVHAEFGHCDNEAYRHTSSHPAGVPLPNVEHQDPPYYILLSTYISYLFLICLGHLRDFFGKRFRSHAYAHLMPHNGYAALNSDFDSFYTRRLKARMDDCFSRPVTGVPGRTIALIDRASDDFNLTFQSTGTLTRALNVSSYNYLGFAQATGGCADAVETSIHKYGMSATGSRLEVGTLDLHIQAEALVARFVGQEAATINSMGFATNSTTLPAIAGKGSLIISDEHNHASIRFGVRISGASVRTFKHNDIRDLENLLREVISQGQPRTHRPWKKILVVVEGLYSMEGTMANLPALIELKRKYKFYLYVDEAHSIGALGSHGRGVCDYFGIDPKNVDILMGTFTKSFGAAGGYISGSKALIDCVRARIHASSYAEAMSPAVLTQIISSMGSIMGIASSNSPSVSLPTGDGLPISEVEDPFAYTGPSPPSLVPAWLNLPQEMRDGSEGRERLRRLAFNVRYLSRGLKKLGFITYGHEDSPIIPMLLFNPGKMCVFSRMMLERKTPIVVVVVAYPATELVTSRVRFCLSASHVKTDVDELLRACDEIGDLLDLKQAPGERWSVDDVIDNALALVKGY